MGIELLGTIDGGDDVEGTEYIFSGIGKEAYITEEGYMVLNELQLRELYALIDEEIFEPERKAREDATDRLNWGD